MGTAKREIMAQLTILSTFNSCLVHLYGVTSDLAGVITGTALSAINRGDLTKGAGIGFGISSINFGVSLVLRLK
jgi:hypothetical protein